MASRGADREDKNSAVALDPQFMTRTQEDSITPPGQRPEGLTPLVLFRWLKAGQKAKVERAVEWRVEEQEWTAVSQDSLGQFSVVARAETAGGLAAQLMDEVYGHEES